MKRSAPFTFFFAFLLVAISPFLGNSFALTGVVWHQHAARTGSVIQRSSSVDSSTEEVVFSRNGTTGSASNVVHPLMDVESRMTSSSSSPATDNRSPAEIENEKFACDETVAFWRNFQINGFEDASNNVRNIANIVESISQNPDRANYWARATGRTGYFVVNALLGNFGSSLHDRLVKGDTSGSPFNALLEPVVASRIFLETALTYQQDYKRIEEGKFKKPYDMYENTRQSSPLYAGQQTARFVREAIGTLGRRKRGTEDDKRIWISDDAAPSLYPNYYRTAFHYQTDGWMS